MKRITYFSIYILLLFHQSVYSQNQSKKQEAISLNHIALYVHDLDKSTAFYKDVVGLKVIPEPFKDGLHTWFTMGGKSQLHLIAGADEPTTRNRNNHLCFTIPSIDDFIKNLEKHHVQWTNWAGEPKLRTLRVDGVTQIYFIDPDGYWIEINNDGYVKK
jgi:lactoylglutathione lyase